MSHADGVGLVHRRRRRVEEITADLTNVLNHGNLVGSAFIPKRRSREFAGEDHCGASHPSNADSENSSCTVIEGQGDVQTVVLVEVVE